MSATLNCAKSGKPDFAWGGSGSVLQRARRDGGYDATTQQESAPTPKPSPRAQGRAGEGSRRSEFWVAVLLAAVLAAALGCGTASAQTYPVRPIRIIVPLPAGGLADILARIVAQQIGESSGQQAVVENRTGGAGAVGGEAAAKSPADGYTLFLAGQGANAVLPHLAKLNFDPAKDFTAVIHIATFPNLLVVNPSLPVKSVQELVAHAKANPGKLSYASQGNGSSGHLVAEQFKQMTGIDMVHVPYRGAAPAVQDLVAGHVQVMFDSVTLQMPHLTAGRTRALAVMAPERAAALPDVPTMREAGFAQMQGGTWFGIVAPTGTPREAIDYVNTETRKAFASPEMRQRFTSQATLLPLGTPEEFAAHITAEREKWGEVIRRANIKME
jgi:tripartite-type tricarboxylate transporter receptor subunit TctC